MCCHCQKFNSFLLVVINNEAELVIYRSADKVQSDLFNFIVWLLVEIWTEIERTYLT